MNTHAISRTNEKVPSFFDDFFKPWNEWFDNGGSTWNRAFTIPPVNITETSNDYQVSLAVPGMKKEDFQINVDGNMLSISCEKEENKEEENKKFTRREYSYSSFNRSFNLPEAVNKEKIDAKYEDGVLKLSLPRKEEAKKSSAKHIAVK